MKLFILLIAQVLLITQNEAAVVPPPVCSIGIEVDVGKIPIPIVPNPGTCVANEVWGCGYCDAACFKYFCCGTPPCHYR